MKEIGLYIHIPFCKSRCLYCDFNSYSDKDYIIEQYVNGLIQEIKLYKKNEYIYKTVFFGGGTPTFIHYKYIAMIMDEILPQIVKGAEISMECNPGTASSESLSYYRDIGINRLSIGLQAWQNQLLQELGRIHEIEDFINTYNLARSIGFNNISVDLMFSLPNQSLNQWRETIGNVCQLKPDHLSCYSLKLEEGTVLNDKYQKGIINIPSDEADREMYHTAIDMLKAYGYKQYEISNFSKPNKECKHNLVYWNNEEYLGIGAGSHSKLNHKRFWNHKSIDRYIDSLINYAAPIESYEDINRDEDMWESIFLALRLNKGLDILKFQETYNVNFMEKYSEALNKLVLQKLIIIEGKNIKLTPLGMDLSNQVFMEFM